jgi:hypothetical protein
MTFNVTEYANNLFSKDLFSLNDDPNHYKKITLGVLIIIIVVVVYIGYKYFYANKKKLDDERTSEKDEGTDDTDDSETNKETDTETVSEKFGNVPENEI